MKVREINLFAAGDSSDIATWSNVPYFFAKSMQAREVRVNRINIIPGDEAIYRLYMRGYELLSVLRRKVLKKDRCYDFYRDRISLFLANQKIKRALRRFPDADVNVFLTFSFSSYQFSNVPVVHYCDLTYEMYLKGQGRKITNRQRRFIRIEKNNLKNAHYIFTTSRRCCEYIRDNHRLANVKSVPAGINLETLDDGDGESILAEKKHHKNVLFIGKGYHKRGVDILVDAFTEFNSRHADTWQLHIVGFSRDSFGELSDNIRCYGQLNKSIPSELACYLGLLRSARLFVMPMRAGPLPGVLKEAALMYTPSIVTNIWNMADIVRDGYNGMLVDRASADDFSRAMEELLGDEKSWEKLARNAHSSAGRYSWGGAVDEILKVLAAG